MTVRHSFIVLFLSLAIGGCAALTKEERNFSKNGLTIAFRSLYFLDDVENIKFIYPILLSEENIRNHLLSLYHQDIVRQRKPRPVFSQVAVKELAPLFKTVMKKVKPGKYLHFEYQASGGITEGQVFASAKKLYWHLLKINGVAYSNDPLRIQRPTWKLVRAPGQSYQIMKTGGFEKAIKNRIVANIKMPFPKQRFPSRQGSQSSYRNQN
ncbi:MAG: hypothetical protein F3743_07870 [Nitrospinae bacterium]|nr:hypothetical protein [Nitrospinota bacterium]MZH13430.1 hypothetical protein [Nitrospinota bacterium]